MKELKTAFLTLIFFTILTGLIYPLLITLLAQGLFPWQANGSLIEMNGKIIGSALIGQSFTSDKYFWGRPSATSPFPYNAASSAGSNMGPSNPDYLTAVQNRVAKLKNKQNTNMLIPVDLVTASGSGLDPDISPLAAYFQASRIAKARHIKVADVQMLIYTHTKQRHCHVLGEPRVNVLQLNLALDALKQTQ